MGCMGWTIERERDLYNSTLLDLVRLPIVCINSHGTFRGYKKQETIEVTKGEIESTLEL